MSMKDYFLPQSLDEAMGLLAEYGPSLLVMAGGTIAMPLINEGVSRPERVMGLRQVGLNYLRPNNGRLTIGATVTLTEILNQDKLPLLASAAGHTAAWAVRNMGTIGGNLFAPPPSGDLGVALLALDASVKLVSRRGEQRMPLAEFYTGFMTHALEPDELLAEIEAPLPRGKTAYVKFGRRQANTPAIVTVAAQVVLDGERVQEARLALNGVGPHPLRAKKAEAVLTGATLTPNVIAAAAEAAVDDCDPFDDPVASAWYRRKMVKVYVGRTLAQLAV